MARVTTPFLQQNSWPPCVCWWNDNQLAEPLDFNGAAAIGGDDVQQNGPQTSSSGLLRQGIASRRRHVAPALLLC
jgi:hypothetical protein